MDRITYTVSEQAETLGISRGNAYELCRQPGFPAVRISERRIIIPRQEQEAWLHKQATEPQPTQLRR